MELYIDDRIRNRKVDFFNTFNLNLQYDSVASSFGFSFYFNPDNKEHVEMACIGHNHLVRVEHNGELLLTGFLLSQGFTDAPVKSLCKFGGYSLTGVLEDCQIPTSIYPLQSDGLTLRQIATKLLNPFKIGLKTANGVNIDSVFKTTTADETQTIKDYLTELATQKNIIITHDSEGNLLFTQALKKQTPILDFFPGQPGSTDMNLTFNGQAMHSHITVVKQASMDGGNAGQYTIRNPYVPFVYRPKVMNQTSGTDNDTQSAAKNALAAELKNLKLVINTDRWTDANGKIIKPNNIITVLNPEIYLFKKTKWFVESVNFVGDNENLTASITCVLPEVYNGEHPEYLFEGINLH